MKGYFAFNRNIIDPKELTKKWMFEIVYRSEIVKVLPNCFIIL